jgi:hypothetical protein
MPRLTPPLGTVTRKQAVSVLQREGIITSASMLEKLKGIDRVRLEGRTHGFYQESQLLAIINSRRNADHKTLLKNIFDEEHKVVCRQATTADMDGVYAVAEKLFGHTTFAENRVPLVRRVPEGNMVVTDKGKIVSYIHIQPLLPAPLKEFLNGDIRGEHLIDDYLDPFESGKVVNVLVKSVGSYHEHASTRKRYSKALFIGLKSEIKRWGECGYIINKVYATSETSSGIDAAADFQMTSLGKMKGTKGKRRFAYVLDPMTTHHPFFKGYQDAITQWEQEHPEEYEKAWREWDERKIA